MTSDYALEVRDKKLFIDLCKNADKPRLHNEMNYLLKYYQECQKRGIVPLPVLFKVRDKKLILEGYRLNAGLCESLSKSFEIYPELLDSITLDDNGISDVDLAKVLEGLTKLDDLKRIIIRNNIFLEASCEVLR